MAIQRGAQHSIQSTNLADLLERVLDKGIVIAGDIKIKLVDVELLTLQIRLVICSVDKAKEIGMDWWVDNPMFGSRTRRELAPDSLGQIEDRLARIESRLPG
ncbi:MAG: gas vesicle protein [Syntrophobacteraceae bacterium]